VHALDRAVGERLPEDGIGPDLVFVAKEDVGMKIDEPWKQSDVAKIDLLGTGGNARSDADDALASDDDVAVLDDLARGGLEDPRGAKDVRLARFDRILGRIWQRRRLEVVGALPAAGDRLSLGLVDVGLDRRRRRRAQ